MTRGHKKKDASNSKRVPRRLPQQDAAVRTLKIAQQCLESIGSPMALSVWILIENKEFDQVFNKTVDPLHYLDSDKFADDYQAVSLLSKVPNFLETDLELPAVTSFKEAEDHCREVNGRVTSHQLDFQLMEAGLPALTDIRHLTRSILGKAPTLTQCADLGGWGPGATYELKRSDCSPELKCEYASTVTHPLAIALQKEGLLSLPWFFQKPWQLVPGNIIVTVPKNAKTDRTIAIEPALNSYCQKGAGEVIRRRLKRKGIDLDDQTLNASACLEALPLGYATIDLKAASDSLSLFLMERLLPTDWFDLLAILRSERGTFASRDEALSGTAEFFDYEKISSMGNGFTFELESCVFYACCLAIGVPPCDTYIYGDDIIIPKMYVPRLLGLFQLLGFRINKEKSFWSGLFRESCGVHAFDSVDITPFKIKELLYADEDIIILANKIRDYAALRNHGCGCDRRFMAPWRYLRGWLSPAVRKWCRGPRSSGLTLFCDPSECISVYSKRRAANVVWQLSPTLRKREGQFESLLLFRQAEIDSGKILYFPKLDSFIRSNGVITRDRLLPLPRVPDSPRKGNIVRTSVKGMKLTRLFVDRWPLYGPWTNV